MRADELNQARHGNWDGDNGDGATANPQGDIVVGVDGSKESFAALRWALDEAGISGQSVNAVFGWATSWDMGAEPETDEQWRLLRKQITDRLHEWVDTVYKAAPQQPSHIDMTSVRATGTAALLQIGANAQQIVVGRRSLGRVMRWFSGSTSRALTEESSVPVTVVRLHEPDERNVRADIADALTPADTRSNSRPSQSGITDSLVDAVAAGHTRSASTPSSSTPTIVAGVDRSHASTRILQFAATQALLHDVALHVIFCWQVKELGVVPGYEHAVAPMDVNQRYAQRLVEEIVSHAGLDTNLIVHAHAFHTPAAKGLIDASRYASQLILGSRGLTGLDAHFLGSVSSQVVSLAECTVTVVH